MKILHVERDTTLAAEVKTVLVGDRNVGLGGFTVTNVTTLSEALRSIPPVSSEGPRSVYDFIILGWHLDFDTIPMFIPASRSSDGAFLYTSVNREVIRGQHPVDFNYVKVEPTHFAVLREIGRITNQFVDARQRSYLVPVV